MAGEVDALYRYPVKGLSPEPLDRVALSVGKCLPHDRRFAIALGTTQFDPARPQWLQKTQFIMLMRDEQLARLQTRFDPASAILSVARDGVAVLHESLTEPGGQGRVAAFFDEFMGEAVPGPLRVVEAPGHAFADAHKRSNATTDQYVSLINRNSIRDLETRLGATVDPLRFRANVYFDGPPAWQEHDWLEREMTLGGARLRVVAKITRCPATDVNPATAERDIAMAWELTRHFGHNLLGVYAEVVAGGEVAVGDGIALG